MEIKFDVSYKVGDYVEITPCEATYYEVVYGTVIGYSVTQILPDEDSSEDPKVEVAYVVRDYYYERDSYDVPANYLIRCTSCECGNPFRLCHPEG